VFSLRPCVYNPISGKLNIWYSIPVEKEVKFRVLDLAGKQIAKFIDNNRAPGDHAIVWVASGVPMGVYLLEMDAGSWRETRKVVIKE
jgi:hypothetical protein